MTATSTTTQAKVAINKLKATYAEIPDSQFGPKDYITLCHGCGKIHAVRSMFMSSSLLFEFRFEDKSSITLGAYKCPTCPNEAIQEAYQKGIARAAYNAAATEIGAILQPEPKPCRLCGTPDIERHLPADGAHNLCEALNKGGLPTPPLKSVVR